MPRRSRERRVSAIQPVCPECGYDMVVTESRVKAVVRAEAGVEETVVRRQYLRCPRCSVKGQRMLTVHERVITVN